MFPLPFSPRATLLAALLSAVPALAPAAEARTEEQLIALLQSPAGAVDKNAACWDLKRVGTARCAAALGALLADEGLSHSARYALESLPGPEAESALIGGLDRSTGRLRAGIIQSLGFRGDAAAAAALGRLLAEGDAATKPAAATALGQIGGAASEKGLESAWAALPASEESPLSAALADALLRCGYHRLTAGERSAALRVFELVQRLRPGGPVGLAAFRGRVQASEPAAALAFAAAAIAGSDGPSQAAALALVAALPGGTEATRKLAALLPALPAPTRAALIGVLAQRGDPAAAPAIAAAADAAEPFVRTAAWAALGALNDAADLTKLAAAAASGQGEEQAAAREALLLLRGEHLTEAILAALPASAAPVQVELARALGDRAEAGAVPRLFDLARHGTGAAPRAALAALARLAERPEIPDLIGLVAEAPDGDVRALVVDALNTTLQRLQAKYGHVDAGPLVLALASGNQAQRLALMPLCATLPDPAIRAALRTGIHQADEAWRTAALRALSDTTDAELAPDLLAAARETREVNLRSLAIGGWIRLAIREQAGRLPPTALAAGLQAIYATPLTVDQTRLLLSGLAEVGTPETLAIARKLLATEAVRGEACRAVLGIARSLPDAAVASAAIREVLTAGPPAEVAATAQTTLREIEQRAAFVTDWKVAGPYVQDGKDYAALFDIPFPPEVDGSGDWRPVPAGSDPKRPWLLDLLRAFGGDRRVAYARTWVHTDQPVAVRLDIGADDGVKVWVNGKLLHGNNASRAISPGSDKVNANLVAGWNQILLKITQNNQGWEFCTQIVSPDGRPAPGLRVDSNR